jgi:hypothetical protein
MSSSLGRTDSTARRFYHIANGVLDGGAAAK